MTEFSCIDTVAGQEIRASYRNGHYSLKFSGRTMGRAEWEEIVTIVDCLFDDLEELVVKAEI